MKVLINKINMKLVVLALFSVGSFAIAGQSGNGEGKTINIGFGDSTTCPQSPCQAPDQLQVWRQRFNEAEPLDLKKYKGKFLFASLNSNSELSYYNNTVIYIDTASLVPTGTVSAFRLISKSITFVNLLNMIDRSFVIVEEFDSWTNTTQVNGYFKSYNLVTRFQIRQLGDYIIFEESECDSKTGEYTPIRYGSVNIKTDRRKLSDLVSALE